MDGSNDSGNFSLRSYLPLIRNNSSTRIHGLTVFVKKGLPFARDLCLENSTNSYLCFRLTVCITQCITSFSSIDHLFPDETDAPFHRFIALLMTILVLIGTVFVII